MSNEYIHLKSGEIYYYTSEVINATNDQEGQVMVLYHNYEGKMFVRDYDEFHEKFCHKNKYCPKHLFGGGPCYCDVQRTEGEG